MKNIKIKDALVKKVLFVSFLVIFLSVCTQVFGNTELDYHIYTKEEAARFLGVEEEQIVRTVWTEQFGEIVPVFVAETDTGKLQIAFPDVTNYPAYVKHKDALKDSELDHYWNWRDVLPNSVSDQKYMQ